MIFFKKYVDMGEKNPTMKGLQVWLHIVYYDNLFSLFKWMH